MRFINCRRTVFLFAFLAILAFIPSFAKAQGEHSYATAEDVAIAFYKTGGVVPNFDRWIKQREPYIRTPWARMDEVYAQEMSRLQLAYRNFNPESDYLMVRTFVRLNTYKEAGPEGKMTYRLKATFSNAPDALYFPFDFLEERIIIMPNKIDVLMDSAITKAEYDFITEALPHSAKNSMIVRMKAKKGNVNQPYEIDGMQQWVLTADIASMEIWSKQGRLLWEYSAPWYISPNTLQLHNLYEEGPISNHSTGKVKPLKYED
jgi:hypothetical protein